MSTRAVARWAPPPFGHDRAEVVWRHRREDLSPFSRGEGPGALAGSVAPTDSARFCAGDSVQLVAPVGSGQYQWSTGDTTRTLWVRTAGSYAVAVAGGGGCFGPTSAPVTVRAVPVPVAPVLTPTQAGGLILLTATPALVGATYTWTGPNGVIVAGATGPTLLLTAAAQNGFYTATLTQRGCASPPSAAVNVTITGLTAEAVAPYLTLTPNPAAGAVRVANAAGLRAVDVRDLAGRLILAVVEVGSEPEITLPLAGVPVGTYLVQATLPDGRVMTRRLVVNR